MVIHHLEGAKRARLTALGQFDDATFSHRTLERATAAGLQGQLQQSTHELFEVEVVGSGTAIHDLIDWCRQESSTAQLTSLTMKWLSD
jgi:hypothetical protein